MGNRLALLAALGCGLLTSASAQLSDTEKGLLRDGMAVGNLSTADLNWDRRPFNDRWRMPLINRSLDDPIATADELTQLQADLGRSSVGVALGMIARAAYGEATTTAPILPPSVLNEALPEAIRRPVSFLAERVAAASAEVREATMNLSETEARALIESLPVLAAETDLVRFDFVSAEPLTLQEALRLLEKVDLRRIRAIAARLSDAIDQVTPELQRSNFDVPSPLVLRVSGIVVRLQGRANDVADHTDSALCIDFGGNDTYTGRVGAGIRYASVLLDLGGDDVYATRDASVGVGLLGIGIARDFGGNDRYAARHLTAGVGVGGVGVLVDGDGHDQYRSNALAQGFASFGVGLLIDGKGDDLYQVALFGQGAARTAGFGSVVDREGDDTYRAGGLMLNAPLFQDVTYSFAQGFASGYREDTGGTSGGVGLLTDLRGRDAYIAETYAQAASYWLSLGGLYDGDGHDTYSAYHYAQSSAMHLCSAYFFDLAGDDAYAMKFGASHAIGHDYGVAFLLDRSGNDNYFAQDSQPGLGNANGLGIFLDATGTDRYQGPSGRGNASRGSGSVGLFIDGSGQDVYREGLADGTANLTDQWGFAYDAPSPRVTGIAAGQRPPRPIPGSLPAPDAVRMEELYAQATQWAVGEAGPKVEEALGKLVGIGLPAANWMIENKLATADRLQARAFVEVLRDVGPDAQQKLVDRIARGTLAEKRVGLGIAVDGRFRVVAPLVPDLMDVPEIQLQAVRAAGVLASRESVGALLPVAAQRNQVGMAAIISLAQIGDEQGYSTAEALLGGPLPVRKASLSLMARFPLRAMESAGRLILEPDERLVRIGIELLGMVGTPESLGLIGPMLMSPSPGIRAQALTALAGQCPDAFRLTFVGLRSDPDPMVRAVASRLEPGR